MVGKQTGLRATVVAGVLGAAVLCLGGTVFAGTGPTQTRPGPPGPGTGSGPAPTSPYIVPPTYPTATPGASTTPVSVLTNTPPPVVRTTPITPPASDNGGCAIGSAWSDLLGRPIDTASLAQWQSYLQQGGDFPEYIQTIMTSDEFRSDEIQQLFQQLLNRPADPAALQSLLQELQQGVTINGVAATILSSDEFYADAGGTDAGWVGALYQQLLGRLSSSQETQPLLDQLSAGATRQQIALTLLSSSEYSNDRVSAWFQQFLGSTPGSDQLHAALAAVQAGESLDQVEAGIFTSPAFLSLKSCATRPLVPGN